MQAFFNLGGQGVINYLKGEPRPESLGWDGGRDGSVSCALRTLPEGEARAGPGQRSPCTLHAGLAPSSAVQGQASSQAKARSPRHRGQDTAGHPARWRRPRNTLPLKSAPPISMFTHVIRLGSVDTVKPQLVVPVPRKVVRGSAVSELSREGDFAACPWLLSSPGLCSQPVKADGELSPGILEWRKKFSCLPSQAPRLSSRSPGLLSWPRAPDEPPGAMLSRHCPAWMCGQSCHNHRLHSRWGDHLEEPQGPEQEPLANPAAAPHRDSSGTSLDHSAGLPVTEPTAS